MKDSDNGYHISFFKPTTERARYNRNIVIWLTTIWFVSIFGFQIALHILEKPTPEKQLVEFENVWDDIREGVANSHELQVFARSTLHVLGKVAIAPGERSLLSKSMSWSAYMLIPDSLRSNYMEDVTEFEEIASTISSTGDREYLLKKNELAGRFQPVVGLSDRDPLTRILPLELTTKGVDGLSAEAANTLPSIMQKYLTHNQSVLTDTKFLGFPFHYFYTAVFLLILFIALCWLYCVRSDRRNKILGIAD